MKTTIKVLFKSMQKDDKKEVLKFEIKGNEDGEAESELFDLSGSIVALSLEVGGDDVCGIIPAEFMNIQRDSKKTVMKFAIKGDSEEKSQLLYRFAGRNVDLSVAPSQISIDEFHAEDEHEGIPYTVGKDGTAELDKNQVSIEELNLTAGSEDNAGTGDSKVTDIRAPRVTKKEKEEKARLAALEQEQLDKEIVNEDELPF